MTSFEEGNTKSRAYQKMRASMHIGMGIFYIIVGIMLLYVKYFGAMELSSGLAYTLGTLMLIYGIFRIWRGWKDMQILKGSTKE